MTQPRLALRMPEVADECGVGVSTVKRWVSEGRLVSVRIGGVVRVRTVDLEAFLAAHLEGQPDAPRGRKRQGVA